DDKRDEGGELGALPPSPRKGFAPFDPLIVETAAPAQPFLQHEIKSRNPLRRLGWKPVLLLPVVFLAVFFFYPLVAIFGVSLTDEAGALDLSGFGEILTSTYYRETLWFTVWQAALSTALTLAAAIPAAFVFTRYTFRGKTLMMSLATLPFVLPTVVVAAAFDALLGERGVVNTVLTGLF